MTPDTSLMDHPLDDTATADRHPTDALVDRARELLDGADPPPNLELLAGQLDVSPWHLHRSFRERTGMTPRAYLAARRLGRAQEALREGRPVTTALYDAGYGSSRAFYEQAPAIGMRPSALRRGGRGVDIRYTSVRTGVGWALLCATGTGVCAVRFCDDADEAVREVAAELPEARLERDDESLAELADELARAVEGTGDGTALPLDVHATAFQLKVWDALRRIPPGETRTYKEVAAEIGSPTAVRAVAGACAANPVAVLVPCHRVVRTDGGLGGYHWGVERKIGLLANEAAGVSGEETVSGSPDGG